MESWIGCAICGQRERLSSHVGVALKRSTQANCPQTRRPSFCEKKPGAPTPSLAYTAAPQTLHFRGLSVRWQSIRGLPSEGNSAGANQPEIPRNFVLPRRPPESKDPLFHEY